MTNNRYQVVNTFSGGMNTDADKSVFPKNQYLYGENFRIFNDFTNTVGSLENILGNIKLSSVITDGYYPIGYCNIRDELYIATTQNQSPTDGLYSELIKVIFSSDGESISSYSYVYRDQDSSDGSRLNWSRDHLIKMVGRYESDTIKKIYFVDGYNTFRNMNVVSVSVDSPVNKFDVIPNFNLSKPVFQSFGTGKLTSGKIQYAYQMYNINGSETLFSPASSLISVCKTSGQSGSNKTFKGSDLNEDTGKGIRISIYPPSGFNRIRVVSIKYNSLNSIPIISIVADQDISTTPSTTYFYDSGISNLGGYTYEEFAILGRDLFIGSEIEGKNNYLFVGNITDKSWDIDFDARAYRFVSSTATGTLTPGHSAIFASGPWGSNAWYNIYNNFKIDSIYEVPETYDCLNPYNDISLDTAGRTSSSPGWVHLYPFMYQVDGTTLGGQGKYVSYKFIQKEFIISDTGTNYGEDYCYNTDYSNTNIEISFVGYQRDEVYRFGIVFFDEKGRQSNVKWIGDIRFPWYSNGYSVPSGDHGTSDYTHSFVYNGSTYGRSLGIQFTVDTSIPYSQGAKYFKIVRAKRETGDRNILAQGVTPTMIKYGDGSGWSYRGFVIPYTATNARAGITKEPTILEFISPEVNFNKNLTFEDGDSLELIGNSSYQYQWDNFSNSSVTIGTLPSDNNYSFTIKYGGITTAYGITNIVSANLFGVPNKSVNVTYQDGVTMIGVDYKVLNFVETTMTGSGSSSHFGPGGTKFIIKVSSANPLFTPSPSSSIVYNAFYSNYRRPVFNSQYGGNTYTARQYTSYIDCGYITACSSSSTSINVYGGDTYVGMFDYLRNIVTGDIPTNRRSQIVMYFPVETSINLRYRSDDCFSKTTDDSSHSRRLMQELAGVYVSDVTYTQLTNLYKYNSVYSQENTTIRSYPKLDTTISGDKIHDNRVIVSDLKIDGEITDSWTIFKLDNFLDVDSKYGGITSLISRDNYLYFWQPRAFGVLSVSQRSVLSDNNPGALVLGTGGVLDRYDYISTNYGATCRFSPVIGLKGLYWVDNINKVICKYDSQGVEPISKSKGINSFIVNSIDLDTITISCSDRKYSEVLFTVPYTYTTVSGNSIQPGTYLATATDIPPFLTVTWRHNSDIFSTIKDFRMVVEVIDVSNNSSYFSDATISIFGGVPGTITRYLRNGTNTWDFTSNSIGTSTKLEFELMNTGTGEGTSGYVPTIPHNSRILIDSIKCYEMVDVIGESESFDYPDGYINSVTGGIWNKQNLLESFPQYPITWEANIISNKLHIETFSPTQLYSVRAVRSNVIPVGTHDCKIEITVSDATGWTYPPSGKNCGFTLSSDNIVWDFQPNTVVSYPRTITFGNYGDYDEFINIDPSKSYDLIFMIQDISDSVSAMSMTISSITISFPEFSEIPFFSETFDSFYRISSVGDVPTGWSLYYRTGDKLTASGYHAGGVSVNTIAPIVYNELLGSFNGIYTFNTDNTSLFITPNNTNYITNSGSDLYMHNLGEHNTFYGIKYPSTLKFIINDNFEEVKTFDSLRFNSTCKTRTGNVDQYDKTFVTIRCYNDYQNSNFQTIYTSGVNTNITRKEREFVLNIPRNRVNLSQPNYPDIFDPSNISNETRLFKERMRDKYLITELLYNDAGNNRFNVSYITTNYRISKR